MVISQYIDSLLFTGSDAYDNKILVFLVRRKSAIQTYVYLRLGLEQIYSSSGTLILWWIFSIHQPVLFNSVNLQKTISLIIIYGIRNASKSSAANLWKHGGYLIMEWWGKLSWQFARFMWNMEKYLWIVTIF